MYHYRPRLFLLLTLMVLFIAQASATEYTGKVVGVHDGDTLTLLTLDKKQVKVRLGEIDTPESKQPYGTRAKQALSDLVFGKQVRVVVQDTDRYGRTVGRVYVGGMDVNAEMVKQGAAWVYRQYAKDASLFALEAQAKAAKRGLWALPEAQQQPLGSGDRPSDPANPPPRRQPQHLCPAEPPLPAARNGTASR